MMQFTFCVYIFTCVYWSFSHHSPKCFKSTPGTQPQSHHFSVSTWTIQSKLLELLSARNCRCQSIPAVSTLLLVIGHHLCSSETLNFHSSFSLLFCSVIPNTLAFLHWCSQVPDCSLHFMQSVIPVRNAFAFPSTQAQPFLIQVCICPATRGLWDKRCAVGISASCAAAQGNCKLSRFALCKCVVSNLGWALASPCPVYGLGYLSLFHQTISNLPHYSSILY